MEKALNKQKEEVIIASIIYVSAIMPFLGLFIPLIIWLLYREKSTFLVFHSLQNLIYQFCGLAVFFLCMVLYIGSFFVVFIGLFTIVGVDGSGKPGPLFLIPFCIPFVVFFGILITFFLYAVYALIGCFVMLTQHDFKYIIIGRLLENYLLKTKVESENMTDS
jgi:uncharacterized Tic20 family protein